MANNAKKISIEKRNRRLPNYVSEYVIKLAQRTELQPSGSLAIDLAHSEHTKTVPFFRFKGDRPVAEFAEFFLIILA